MRAEVRIAELEKALAVVRVKGFDFKSGAVGLREQSHAAVGHGAVHIHEEYFDLRSALLQSGRDCG